MNRFFALLLLVVVLVITYWFSVFGAMSAQNKIQWLAASLLPVATVPVGYFLLIHGVLAQNAAHAWQGLSTGIYISLLNFLVWVVLAAAVPVLSALGLSEYSMWPLLILLLTSQTLMLVHFHKKIRLWLNQPKEQSPE